jgi:predicted ATP-grasp superfamily ATP-dependent carboligase
MTTTVLVLDGNENQAVAATRSLSKAGHRVLVGAETSWSKAGWSRHAAGAFAYPDPARDVDGFTECLLRTVRAAGGAFVLPMTERTLLPVSLCRARIADAGGAFVLPAHERVVQACSKEQTTALARDLGLVVPRTWTLGADAVEARRLSGDLPYPVVLKPAMSHEPLAGAMRATGAPAYATSQAEFLDEWRGLAARARAIVVQEFVPGTGAGYFALMQHGAPQLEFAHRRIRDVRATGSGSAVRESVPLAPAIRDASRRLLAALDWHGVAMVEFRLRGDGTPVFLEVNGRFWNSLALAIAAGADFPRHLVELGISGRIDAPPAYRPGVRCRWWLGDVRHLLDVLRGAPRGYPGRFPGRLATLAAVLTPSPGTVHDNFRWSDPLPELGDWLHFFGRRLPAYVARRSDAERTAGAGGALDAEGRAAHP